MLIESRIRTQILQSILFLSGAAVAMAGGADPAPLLEVRAGHVRTVDLNTTYYAFHGGGIGSECFEAYAPPGIFKLDVAVPGGAAAEPRLSFHGRADGTTGERRSSFSYVERSATSLLLDIHARGTYFFCVAAQDPSLRLEEYKLANAHVSRIDMKVEVYEEDEPDPDSLRYGCGGGVKDHPADAGLGPRDPRFRRALAEICRSTEADDHGDTAACATVFDPGHAVAGEILNDRGDDHDFFALRLTELRTIEITTTGGTDTFGSLHDRSGHRLAADDDGGDGGNFRIAKTLAPGWYFVRIEGRHRSEGTYDLSVDVSSL